MIRLLAEACRDLGDYAAARTWLDRGLALIHEVYGRGPSAPGAGGQPAPAG